MDELQYASAANGDTVMQKWTFLNSEYLNALPSDISVIWISGVNLFFFFF